MTGPSSAHPPALGDPNHGRPIRFAVVDIETSGLSIRRHRILQIAVVIVENGEIVDEWSSLIGLRWRFQRIGPRRLHGIGRRDLRTAPPIAEVLAEFARRVDGCVVTAHNIRFDWTFLERAAHDAGVALPAGPRLCTLRASRRLDPGRTLSHRLTDVCARYGITNDRPHDALHDARATAALLPHLLRAHGIDRPDAAPDALYERR